ncbi:MAG TPA: hypothetical protein VGW10_14250 [Solirubrobacteraceae bacterium]|nr:hypothetical protein [Solirubrobacteraceae bacterium]
MRRLLNRFLRNQSGVALPVVLGSLTVVTGLAAGTFMVTVEGNHASARDRDSKKALGAAEAGLQMASLKLTELNPGVDKCVTLSPVDPGTSGAAPGECPMTDWQPIGNGARYRYTVATPTSGSCPTVPGFTPSGLDRCITSIGEVNGIRRRLQLRFYFRPPFLPWGHAGLVGKNKVDIGLNKTINSPVGTNGQVLLGNNSQIVGDIKIPDTAAPPQFGQHASATLGVTEVPEWQFPELDWATPKTDHNNAYLDAQLDPPVWDGKYLKLNQQQDITLVGGTYYLCGFDAPNGNTINVPDGQFVRMYILGDRGDSSWCNENDPVDGRFVIKNDGVVNPLPVTDPKAEQFALFVYGTDPDNHDNPPDVDMNNGVAFWGTIWAPNSTIQIKNNQTIKGGFTGGTIDMKNNGGFSYDSDIANQALPGTARAENLSWAECKRDPATATDPESGCS